MEYHGRLFHSSTQFVSCYTGIKPRFLRPVKSMYIQVKYGISWPIVSSFHAVCFLIYRLNPIYVKTNTIYNIQICRKLQFETAKNLVQVDHH